MDLSILLNKVNEINIDERQCTQELLREWKDTLPLLQKKILINCHITTSTLLLIELFLFSGAEVKITCTDELVCHGPIKDIISNLGIYISPNEIFHKPYIHYFDVILDCGAYLANFMQPKRGFIELTHVENSKYQSTHCPIISVDSGFIKKIETNYGTGDGFVRAIEKIYLNEKQDFKEKKYMIFGYGKVGQGIATCLLDAGVSQANIMIVESCERSKEMALNDGFSSLSIKIDIEAIKTLLLTTNCAVTATGVLNSISFYLTPESFSKVEYLANMGTHDEWGYLFPIERVLHDKRPLNFMLDYPTRVCYLDPIFAVLASATIDILNQEHEQQFIIKKPALNTEKKILNAWLQNNKMHKDKKDLWLRELSNHV